MHKKDLIAGLRSKLLKIAGSVNGHNEHQWWKGQKAFAKFSHSRFASCGFSIILARVNTDASLLKVPVATAGVREGSFAYPGLLFWQEFHRAVC